MQQTDGGLGPGQKGGGTERLHALDAVRAVALLLGIVLHACVSFMPSTRANGGVLADDDSSAVLDALYLFIHLFRMPLFFMIAGFFARLALQRRGTEGFVRDRAQRILLPFALGCAIINPIGVWIIGAVAQAEGRPFSDDWNVTGVDAYLPMSHLWFLWMLLVLYALALALRWGLAWVSARMPDRRGRFASAADAAFGMLLANPLGPVLLGLPLAVALYTDPMWWPAAGIRTPDYSLIPLTPALVGYGVAFGAGWLLHRQLPLLKVLARDWSIALMGAVIFTAGCVAIGGASMMVPVQTRPERLVYALCYCAAGWYWVLGLTGAAMRFLSDRERPAMRYLADASYWMYLWHVPLVFAMQAAVMHWDAPWPIKFAAVLGVVCALLLASYQLLVRHTWMGRLLDGRLAAPAAPPPVPSAQARAAFEPAASRATVNSSRSASSRR